MDPEKVAFWGLTLKPGEPADLELEDGETLHVTNASFGEELADEKGRSVITASIRPGGDGDANDDDDDITRKFAMCCLNVGRNETSVLDVSFVGEESLTFEVTGKNVVHLVGSFSYDDVEPGLGDDDDDLESGLIGTYDDEDDEDEDGDLDDDDKIPDTRLLLGSKDDAPIITEIGEDDDDEEDEDEDEDQVSVLKGKGVDKKSVPNGKSAPASKKNAKNAGGSKPKKAAAKPDKSKKTEKVKDDEDDVMKDVDSDEIKKEEEEGDSVTPSTPKANGKAKGTPGKKDRHRKRKEPGSANNTPNAKKMKTTERQEEGSAKKDKSNNNEAEAAKDEDKNKSANNTPTSANKKNKKRKGKGKKNNNAGQSS